MKPEVKAQLDQYLEEKQVLTNKDIEKHEHETPAHSHATRSFDKFCTDCGDINPNYQDPKWFCANEKCQAPIGTDQDMEKSKKCYNCGGLDAIIKETDNDD